jgi:DtxR family transcriptional regulator, iron-dependent repressor
VLRLENEAEELLHYMKRTGVEPGEAYTVTARSGTGEDAETELERSDGERIDVQDALARTVSVRVVTRGDGAVSELGAAAAELQLVGPDRWGM